MRGRITKRERKEENEERERERKKVVSLHRFPLLMLLFFLFLVLAPLPVSSPWFFLSPFSLSLPHRKYIPPNNQRERERESKKEKERERENTTVSRCSILQGTEATKNGSRFSLPLSPSLFPSLSFSLSLSFLSLSLIKKREKIEWRENKYQAENGW